MANGLNKDDDKWGELDRKMYGGTTPSSTTPRAPLSVNASPTALRSGGFGSYLGGQGLSAAPISAEDPRLAQSELDKTRIAAAQRILNDPIARAKNPDFLIKDLERIAKGNAPASDGGIPGAFKSGVGNFLEGMGYALNRPLALVTSAAKEIADIPSGGFSVEEFVKQALAKDTAPSKYISKTGVGWIDQVIGLTADIVSDPLTYVTFGASQFAGRIGRLNLAAKAAEAENLVKAPSLLAKINDGSIAKLGEWALDANERAVLGVRPGLSWAFGKGGTIGREGTTLAKLSEGAASVVGKPLAKTRGALSDTGLFAPLQKLTTPKKVKIAGLEMYGRAVDDPEVVNRVADLASYSAGIRGNAAGAFVEKKFGSAGQVLAKEIFDYEQATGRRIFEVMENVRPAVDSAEQNLANRTRKFLDDMREYANTTTGEFAGRRNVDAMGIAHRESYVPHTLTPEAKAYVMRRNAAGTSSSSAIKQMLGMNVQEFSKGPGILRGRTLQKGQKWLGETLDSDIGDGAASIAEINRISNDKLGFKWFEEDGAQYLSNYLDSIVNQTKRVAFVDRLFDYGGEAVKKLTITRTPNTRMAKQFAKIIDGYDNLISPILRQLSEEAGDVQFVLGPRLRLAQALVNLKPGERILSDAQLDEMGKVLDATFSELKRGRSILTNSGEDIYWAYVPMLNQLEENLNGIRIALQNTDETELISRLGLRELYSRLFPGVDIPADFKTMAEDILDASEVYFADQFKKTWGKNIKDVLDEYGAFPPNRTPQQTIYDYTSNPQNFIGFPGSPITSASNLQKLTEFLKQQSEPNKYQLFRGAGQSPIEDIFRNAEFPGKPLSFSEDYQEALNFVPENTGGVFSFEPGELRGIDLNKLGATVFPNEDEFLVDPYSIVEATAKRLSPEFSQRLSANEREILRKIEEAQGLRDSASAVAESFQAKPARDRAIIAENAIKSLDDEIKALQSKGVLTPAEKGKITRKQKKIDELRSVVDAAGSLADQREIWDQGVGAIYDEDIAKLSKLVKANPPPGFPGEVTAIWATRTRNVLNGLSGYGMQLSPVEADMMTRIVKQMKGLESRLAMLEADKAIAVNTYNKIVSGEIAQRVSTDVIKGWEAIESLGVQMPPEIRERMFAKVAELGTPEGASTLRKMYDSYTRFFKVTAMLSPGFIVRNSYTAAFNNFVAGVSIADTRSALRFAKDIWTYGVDDALKRVPANTRSLYEQALRVAYATGAGQTYDDILAPVLAKKGGSKFLNLKPVKKWSDANETAEVAFRFALGLSSIKKGMDFDSAVGVVSRYHFDYTDLSKLDEVARKFIPFWIFASRNIPLQIVNQIARPSVYRMYESVQRNYGLSEEEMQNYPEWLRNRGPLRLPGMGKDQTLIPDLPQLDMREQIGMMSDPMRLMSQANPLVKLPIELMGGRQLWNNIPFNEKPVDVRGPLDYPAYAIDALLGRATQSDVTGQRQTTSKAAYALPNLLPTLGQFQRLIPQLGGKEAYQSRQGSSVASYVGLPYRRVAPEEQFNELTRRQFAIRDYLSNLTRTGQILPKQ